MKILVVHDRSETAREIVDLLKSVGSADDEVLIKEDVVSARSALGLSLFDFAVIDLTIPYLKGRDEASFDNAEHLLSEIFASESLNVPGDIIGITRDLPALEAVGSEVGPHLMAIIEEDANGRWRERLIDRYKYCSRAAISRQRSANQHHVLDVAIIAALDKEFFPFEILFETSAHPFFPGAKTFLFSDINGIARRGLLIAVGRAGQASAASLTQEIITQFRPSLVVMPGFCGGFSEKTNIGDVIVAESVFDWDSGKWVGKGRAAKFFPRPDPISIKASKLHLALRRLVANPLKDNDAVVGSLVIKSEGRISKVKMRLGPIASGSAVVADASIIERIQGLNEGLLGVDMEAYGLYYAATRTNVIRPECVLIKSVADHADRSKDDKDQPACCFLSAKVVEELLINQWAFGSN